MYFLLLLIILIFSGEIYVRYYLGFNKDTRWAGKYVPNIGSIFIPGEEVTHSNYLDFMTTTKVNSIGFLDKELSTDDLHTLRIAVIGDSFVEDVQVPIKDKFHVVLEGMLQQSGIDSEISAFGYSGTG